MGRFSRWSETPEILLPLALALLTKCLSVRPTCQGFEGFLSSKDALRKRARNFKLEDRAFSLSSVTSPAVRSMHPQSNIRRVPYMLLG